MSYGNKYLFKWESIHHVEHQIRILQDGYSGTVTQRHLGGAPVLKMQQNDCVKGTSLEWKAECSVDGEFADLYTSSAREFSVELYRGGTKIWTGFISPELYSEPDIAPPYDVNLVATDGLGELKLYDYPKSGQQSIRSILQIILGYTGQVNEIYFISQLHTSSVTDINFLRTLEMNLDFEAGESCYDVLQEILATLHATITLYRGKWLIVRETDFEITGTAVRAIAAGTRAQSSETTITDAVYSIGQMGVADMWPVGYSSTKIDPAKKRVIVEAPWHPANGVTNGDFASATGWTRPTNSQNETTSYVAGIPAMHLGPNGNITKLYQDISLSGISAPISLKVLSSRSGRGRTGGALNIDITYKNLNDVTYYLATVGDTEGNEVLDWTTTAPSDPTVRQALTSATSIKENADTIEVTIPPLPSGVTSGSLRLQFSGAYVYVFSVDASVVLGKGYRDTLNIDNGARGDGDKVEILTGYTPEDVSDYLPFLQGILLYNDHSISAFSDGNFSSIDFLALTSRGYALSVALPRLVTTGHFNMPATKTYAPLLLAHGGITLAVRTYNWDLLEEELDLESISLPAASLTVDDETVESMGDADIVQTGSTSSSGGGGGGGGSVNAVKVNGSTYNPNSSGLVTLPNYPTMLRNPNSLILSKTQNGTIIKEYNGEQGVTFTAADLEAALDGIFATQSWVLGKHYASQTALEEIADDVIGAKEDIVDLTRKVTDLESGAVYPPVIQIVSGYDAQGHLISPYIRAQHPLIGSGLDAEFVLMVWSNRRGRRGSRFNRPKYRRGWGEARGKSATASPVTFTDKLTLYDLRMHIIGNYICGYGMPLTSAHAMSWQTFTETGAEGDEYAFGGLNNFTGAMSDFWSKVSRHRMFGIAVRIANPEFDELVSGTVDETTRAIDGVPRYIYSVVTPFRVIIGRDIDRFTTMGIQLQPTSAPKP